MENNMNECRNKVIVENTNFHTISLCMSNCTEKAGL